MEKNIEKDVKALANAWFKNVYHHNDCEFGTIGSDCKRPFGNSSVEEDVLELIGAVMEGDDGYQKCYSSSQRKYAYCLATDYMPKFIRENVKV